MISCGRRHARQAAAAAEASALREQVKQLEAGVSMVLASPCEL